MVQHGRGLFSGRSQPREEGPTGGGADAGRLQALSPCNPWRLTSFSSCSSKLSFCWRMFFMNSPMADLPPPPSCSNGEAVAGGWAAELHTQACGCPPWLQLQQELPPSLLPS